MSAKPQTPPPAYFLSLSLENVRSFGDKQTISFARPDGRPAQWTIILGDNGVGKTTVLKSLAGLVPLRIPIEVPMHDNMPGFPSHLVTEHYTPRYYQEIMSKWIPSRKKKEVTGKVECSFSEGTLSDKRETYKNIKTAYFQFLFDSKNEFRIGGHSVFEKRDLGLICYSYGAGRTVGNSNLSEPSESVDLSASLFDDRADLLNPEEWFLQLDYSSRISSDNHFLTRQRELVENALLTVLPEIEAVRITSTGSSHKIQLSLEFLSPYGWVRLRDMSLGYQTLVVWLTDFASKLFIRYPDSKNPLEEPAIVLIDEIDLHLHPSWQRKLIGFLSGIFKNTQFIATAHSPLVVQAAGDAGANVVLLRREGDQTVVVQDLPDVHRWRLEQILSSELFDDTPPLSPQTETDFARRNELLLKKRLTAKEQAELERLDAALTTQPIGTTAPERRAEDLLARLARNLGKGDILE